MTLIQNTSQLFIGFLSSLTLEWLFVFLISAVIVFATLLFATWLMQRRHATMLKSLASMRDLMTQHENNIIELEESNAVLEQTVKSIPVLRTEIAVAERELLVLKNNNTESLQQLSALREKYHQQSADYSGMRERLDAEKKSLTEKLELLNQNREQMAGDFKVLADKIFEEKTERFSKNSEKQLETTLGPLKTQLNEFRKRVDDVYSNEAKERHLLKDQITQLRAESLKISEDAQNLTNALRYDNKTQGNWGELTLVRALEMCGLREPEEYETQVSLLADDAKRQIPDVIVHLPGGKDIIIDSKVSLLAYSRYFEAETDEQRNQAVTDHLHSVQQHIKQLSDKSYQNLPGVTTLDYVMLYIPIEGASSLALQSHSSLWDQAYAKNIVLVSPTNLLAILRSVETIWRHEKQNKNAEEIARQAGNLHDKFLGLIKSFDAVGKNLEVAKKSYDQAYSQLTTGRGNLVARVQNLEKLGAKTKQSIPQHLQLASEQEIDSSNTIDSDTLGDTINIEKKESLSKAGVENEVEID